MLRADRTPFWANLDVAVAKPFGVDTAGQEPVYRIAINDVTQLHALQEIERRMLYTVAHDLRVPATIINGYLPFLLELLPADCMTDEGKTIVTALQRALQRMHIIVNDLTEVTYLQSGRLHIDPKPVNLDAYLRELLPHFANILETSRIILDIPADLPAVNADPNRLERIIINLLLNAQKYSPSPTPISLSAQQHEAEVVISVHDQGRGIPRERTAPPL